MVCFERMAEWSVEAYFVDVVATLLLADDVSRFDQVGHDAVHRTLTDTDEPRNVHEPNFRILGDAQENVCVIGEEGPTRNFRIRGGGTSFHDVIVPRRNFPV